MQRAIESGKKAAILMAFGATLPEFFYTYIALYGFDFFNNNTVVNEHIQLIATIIFFLLATYFLSKKPEVQRLEKNEKENYFDFGRGFLIGTMNLLIIPFWIFIAIWLQSYDFTFLTQSEIILFSLGAALGALLVFLAYAELGHLVLQKIGTVIKYTNKVVGLMFLGLGVYQLTQILR